jgi:predicted nucleic acid-binding protein
MVVVVDANVILSAIVNTHGNIATLLITNSSIVDFVIPEFSLVEIKEKEKKLYFSQKVSSAIFNENLQSFLSCLTVVGDEQIDEEYFKAAYALTKEVDPKDTMYIALTMALDALLWTGDLKLFRAIRKKGFNQVINTKELQQIVKGIQ